MDRQRQKVRGEIDRLIERERERWRELYIETNILSDGYRQGY
jgi:hypothetical protein